MNFFKVFAHGETFDVDAFLRNSTLNPDYVWRRGDQLRYSCIEGQYPTSGVEFVLGDGTKLSVSEQEDLAVSYIKSHRNELRALADFPGAETFILGLQYVCDVKGVTSFCMGPSMELMWHALDIRIYPNYYVTLNHGADSETQACAIVS